MQCLLHKRAAGDIFTRFMYHESMRVLLVLLIVIASLFGTPSSVPAANAPELDPRIGVAHVGGAYPDRTANNDFLNWGANRAYLLGFRNLTVMMMQNLCIKKPHHPLGLYQTTDYCQETFQRPRANKLKDLAQEKAFRLLFAKPFRNFFIFTDSLDLQHGANQSQIGDFEAFTKDELAATKEEYHSFATYLLQTYKGTNKSFILIAPSELDHRLMKNMNCKPVVEGAELSCFNLEGKPVPVANAIAYLNAISEAIHTAVAENPVQGVRVYHACEINHVIQKSLNNPKIQGAIDQVIPYTHCDLIAYSAFETFLKSTIERQNLMTNALNYIASKAPNHPDFPNGKNVFLSQFGIRENIEPSDRFSLFTDAVNQALDWGVPFVQFWTLHDDNCTQQVANGVFPATNADCVGFWMKKPDNTNSRIYNYILENYAISPSPPPTGNIADLTDEGDIPGNQVNEYDYNVLVGDFGKTGAPGWIKADIIKNGKVDEFDYNVLVGDFDR